MFKKNGISHLYFAFVFNESKTQYFLEKFENTKRVIRRKTDNTKKKDNRQTMMYKTLHRKLTNQHDPTKTDPHLFW